MSMLHDLKDSMMYLAIERHRRSVEAPNKKRVSRSPMEHPEHLDPIDPYSRHCRSSPALSQSQF
jgi:hypothetical protein